MSEKEINPLKRGRIQKQTREQKKKTILGEISDPFTVLNDSIATKNYQQKSVRSDYIPSEKTDHAKTTTVDAIDPLSDADYPPREKINETRPPRNGKRGLQRNGRRSESNFNDSRSQYDETRHGYRNENGQRSESSSGDGDRSPYDETRRNGGRNEEWTENSPQESKPKCGLKCLLNKVLSLLNFGSRCNKNCSCSKKNNQENEAKRTRTNSRCANARGGRNRFRPSQNKFK